MTKLLDRAIEKARDLPSHRQDELGEMVLAIVEQEQSELKLSFEQQAEVRRRLAEPQPLVAIDDMEQFFRKLGG